MTSEHVRVHESAKHSGINVRGPDRDKGVSPVAGSSCCLLGAVTKGNCAPIYAQSLSPKDLTGMT